VIEELLMYIRLISANTYWQAGVFSKPAQHTCFIGYFLKISQLINIILIDTIKHFGNFSVI